MHMHVHTHLFVVETEIIKNGIIANKINTAQQILLLSSVFFLFFCFNGFLFVENSIENEKMCKRKIEKREGGG